MHLLGVDRRGAFASWHDCSATGGTLSTVFQDPADFATLALHNAFDFFSHRYLNPIPDFDLRMTLDFDVALTGLHHWESLQFQSIPWASLSFNGNDGSAGTVDLRQYITSRSGRVDASKTFTVTAPTPVAFDRTILTFERYYLSDYIVPNPPTGVTETTIRDAIVANVNLVVFDTGTPVICSATAVGTNQFRLEFQPSNYGSAADANRAVIQIQNKTSTLTVDSTGGSAYTGGLMGSNGAFYPISGATDSTSLHLTIPLDTMVTIPTLGNPSVSVDATKIRDLWLTFAPPITAGGADLTRTEGSAVFTNWSVTDTHSIRALKIAHPTKSNRVNSHDTSLIYTGTWTEEDTTNGFFYLGRARQSQTTGDKIIIQYACGSTHDLYVGTRLYADSGQIHVSVDGAAAVTLDCYQTAGPFLSRIKVVGALPKGQHKVVITLPGTKNAASSGYHFYFDYLEAAVRDDVQDPITTQLYTAASDYDTSHGYQLSPEQVVWMQQRLGMTGDWYHYAGVLWLRQTKKFGGNIHSATATFAGWSGIAEDSGNRQTVAIIVSGTSFTRTFNQIDTNESIAQHLTNWINSSLVGVRASVTGAVITMINRSPVYDFTLSSSISPLGGTPNGTIVLTGDLLAGNEGVWQIDPTVTPKINKPARDWHDGFYAALFAAGYTAVTALSQEGLSPPDGTDIWIQRYANGTFTAPGAAVLTATGFGTEGAGFVEAVVGTSIKMTGHGYATGNSINIVGYGTATITVIDADHFTWLGATPALGAVVNRNLQTAQMAFSSVVTTYLAAQYTTLAAQMDGAGLAAWLTFGEKGHWFFGSWNSGCTVTNTTPIAVFAAAHGRTTGEIVTIVGVRGTTSANSTFQITVTGANTFTLDSSAGNAAYVSGGTVYGGSMALYDADQASAAASALGRPLVKFYTQDDDPTVNPTDVAFLWGRVKDQCDGIKTAVTGVVPGAKFEWLYPLDVNHPSLYWNYTYPFAQGGRLNYAINTPPAWLASGSTIDRIHMEALSWGISYHNLDLAVEAMRWPFTTGTWSKADCAYLVPLFNDSTPWQRETLKSLDQLIGYTRIFASDQLHLLSWDPNIQNPRTVS